MKLWTLNFGQGQGQEARVENRELTFWELTRRSWGSERTVVNESVIHSFPRHITSRDLQCPVGRPLSGPLD